MASYTMQALPELETGTTLEQVNRNLKTVKDWLYQLNEQLKYNLYNMETDNMTQETVDRLTSVSDDVKAELSVLDGKITAAVSAADGRFSALEVSIDGITAQVQDAQGNISSLQQTATSLTSTIESVEGDISSLQQTSSSLSASISNAQGDISNLELTANSLTSRISNAEGDISEVSQTADKINWVVQSGTSASNFTLTSKMASLVADQVKIQTDNLQISGIKYDTTCYVQCGQNEVSIWSSNWGANIEIGAPSGSITLNGDTTLRSPLSVMVDEYGSISSDCLIDCYGVIRARRKLETDIIKRRSASVGVTFENAINVGADSWDETAEGYVYCGKVVESSDARLKQDVEGMDQDTCLAFIMSLRPVSFRFIYSPNVTEYGFIAQEVRQSEIDIGMEDGVVVETGKRYGEYENTLSMKYDNLIAPIVKVIQRQQAEIDKLKEAVGIG